MTPKTALTRASPIEERAPEIIKRLSKAYPDAHVALNFTNPLECLSRRSCRRNAPTSA